MFAKSKLNNIDTLISQALIDMDISHEEFITILIDMKIDMKWWKKLQEMKMENCMELWDLIVWNQRLKK